MVETAETVILARGIDTLYLYLDQGVDFKALFSQVETVDFDQEISINGLVLVRTKAYLKAYPVCMRFGPFAIYFNRVSIYVQVSALGFEMRGFEGSVYWFCEVLDQLNGYRRSWLEWLKVSRIDVFTDFVFEENDFNPEQFKTKLRARGIFVSGKAAEGKTYYFGNRSRFCVRLYQKAVEIGVSGKGYLSAQWRQRGYAGGKVWRLEFEYRKTKLDELGRRELVNFDESFLNLLWSHGIENIQYMANEASFNNLYREAVHPVWQELNRVLMCEYEVTPGKVKKASLEYRYKMARKAVLSYAVIRYERFEDIPEDLRIVFALNGDDFEKAQDRVDIWSAFD